MDFTEAQLQERAKEMSEAIKRAYHEDANVDVDRMAKAMGFEVTKSEELGLIVSAQMFVSADGTEKRIVVNAKLSPAWQKFNLMRALASYLLHYQPESGEEYRQEVSCDEQDGMAGTLAMNVLVPTQYLRTITTLFQDWTIPELEQFFNMPNYIITTQLRAIGAM